MLFFSPLTPAQLESADQHLIAVLFRFDNVAYRQKQKCLILFKVARPAIAEIT